MIKISFIENTIEDTLANELFNEYHIEKYSQFSLIKNAPSNDILAIPFTRMEFELATTAAFTDNRKPEDAKLLDYIGDNVYANINYRANAHNSENTNFILPLCTVIKYKWLMEIPNDSFINHNNEQFMLPELFKKNTSGKIIPNKLAIALFATSTVNKENLTALKHYEYLEKYALNTKHEPKKWFPNLFRAAPAPVRYTLIRKCWVHFNEFFPDFIGRECVLDAYYYFKCNHLRELLIGHYKWTTEKINLYVPYEKYPREYVIWDTWYDY